MPTTVRVIDYVANAGGGERFAVELLGAPARRGAGVRVQPVSHAAALGRYQELLAAAGVIDIDFRDVAPAAPPAWRFDVPAAAFEGCDTAWLPWVHRHRLPGSLSAPVVVAFHAAIRFQFSHLFEGLLPAGSLAEERSSMLEWFES